MARFSTGFRTTGAGTTLLPMASLYAVAGSGGILRQVSIFNTTATAAVYRLVRLDSAGTKPAAETDNEYDQNGPVALCLAHNLHTSTGPTIDEEIERLPVGAAIASGVIFPFGGSGIIIPLGTANGVGIVVATGTGQICDVGFVWEE